MTSGTATRTDSRERGFVLMLTLTLLAFVVLLLVGVATFARVETATSGASQHQAQARENARLALSVALYQLQKYAGPDQRSTASGEAFAGASGRHLTGVWDAAGGPVLSWLISGSEHIGMNQETTLATLINGSSPVASDQVLLVDRSAGGGVGQVRAAKQPILAPGVPGYPSGSGVEIGRYAWWIADMSARAPVAIPDVLSQISYTPFAAAGRFDLRNRIRQQIGLGAGAAYSNGQPVFDVRSGMNEGLVADDRVMLLNQLSFLYDPVGVALDFDPVQRGFHMWSPNNFAVLANTADGGLRRDLSLRPGLLGRAFEAWANYDGATGGHMEIPESAWTPPPLQPYSADPVRRRHRMTSAIEDDGIAHRIGPVLSFFGISFSVRNDTQNNTPTALEVSARCVVGLWNPFSSALVPEDLELVVTGLPTVFIESGGAPTRVVNLQERMANLHGEVTFALPFTPNDTDPDRSSWLPGRVYNWSAPSMIGDPGPSGYPMEFYSRVANMTGEGVVREGGPPLGPNTLSGVRNYRVVSVMNSQVLRIGLRKSGTGETLATFSSPEFEPFRTDPGVRAVGALASDFAYVFRLPDQFEVPFGETHPWLTASGRDPREPVFPSEGRNGYLIPGGQEPRPELLMTPSNSGFKASYAHLLLDRYTGTSGRNFNEDVPVFELPRSPLLSLGSLQHLLIAGERPFSVGNSWGGSRNAWFDRYFFSGLTPEVTWQTLGAPLPNPLLKVRRRRVDGTSVTPNEIRADEYSSRFLMQSGAFNLNSVSREAWIAMLRNMRFSEGAPFHHAQLVPQTGTTPVNDGDRQVALTEPWRGHSWSAAFPRFAQSAQETFSASDGYRQAEFDPPTNVINTPLFRRGIRFLPAPEVAALAEAICDLMLSKHADSGPYRSLREFLSPVPLFVGSEGEPVSLLEKAIEVTQLNSTASLRLSETIPEFSTQWLTQADIMTVLAPVLFPRSDTFVIRAYGEVINPQTRGVEGRAWCEATVQRIPDYVEPFADDASVAPSALTSERNIRFGRRFQVTSFRWLTRSDI